MGGSNLDVGAERRVAHLRHHRLVAPRRRLRRGGGRRHLPFFGGFFGRVRGGREGGGRRLGGLRRGHLEHVGDDQVRGVDEELLDGRLQVGPRARLDHAEEHALRQAVVVG